MTKTPLAIQLARFIEANGPISVAEYMAVCLGDPEHGYYATRDPLGANGDFTTAPEISQMFGEIVGAWLADTWRRLGAPSPVRLAELGPGRGTLMADVLRVAVRLPEFRNALSVHLVETSPALRRIQSETLAGVHPPVRWHATVDEMPAGPLLVIANEFFDALPVHQFVRVEDDWRERVVGLEHGNMKFGIGAPGLSDGPPAPAESVLELRPAADAIVSTLARRIVRSSGAALIIDYGYARSTFGDTLQAVARHAFADPLVQPGEADLTAHVDFERLSAAARAAGAWTHGPIGQGEFLLALGLMERASRLGTSADAGRREDLRLAVERLANPDHMGALFKVLAITPPGTTLPPFPEPV